jgi:hypothetical protein
VTFEGLDKCTKLQEIFVRHVQVIYESLKFCVKSFLNYTYLNFYVLLINSSKHANHHSPEKTAKYCL